MCLGGAAGADVPAQPPAQQAQALQQQPVVPYRRRRLAQHNQRRRQKRLDKQAACLQAAVSSPRSASRNAMDGPAPAASALQVPLAQPAGASPRPGAGLAESEAGMAPLAAACVEMRRTLVALKQRAEAEVAQAAVQRRQPDAQLLTSIHQAYQRQLADAEAALSKLRAAQERHLAAMRASARQLQQLRQQSQTGCQPRQPPPQQQQAGDRESQRRPPSIQRPVKKTTLPLLGDSPEFQQALGTFLELGGLRYLGSCSPAFMTVSGAGTGIMQGSVVARPAAPAATPCQQQLVPACGMLGPGCSARFVCVCDARRHSKLRCRHVAACPCSRRTTCTGTWCTPWPAQPPAA